MFCEALRADGAHASEGTDSMSAVKDRMSERLYLRLSCFRLQVTEPELLISMPRHHNAHLALR
jgi:hypothetical protein